MAWSLPALALAAAVAAAPTVLDDRWMWRDQPTADQLAAAYPREAARRGLDGWATVRCQVAPDGHLSACALISENPEGMGFGTAALRLAPLFSIAPGAPPGSTMRFPIRFQAVGKAI